MQAAEPQLGRTDLLTIRKWCDLSRWSMKSGSQCQTAYHLLHFAMHVPRFRRKYGGANMYILDPVIRNPSSDKVKTH